MTPLQDHKKTKVYLLQDHWNKTDNSASYKHSTDTVFSTNIYYISLYTTMVPNSKTPWWEAPKISFDVPNQAEEWKISYMKAVDFLETLDIDADREDDTKQGWWQMKMMFHGEDRQSLQTLINNNTITLKISAPPPMPLSHTVKYKRYQRGRTLLAF